MDKKWPKNDQKSTKQKRIERKGKYINFYAFLYTKLKYEVQVGKISEKSTILAKKWPNNCRK